MYPEIAWQIKRKIKKLYLSANKKKKTELRVIASGGERKRKKGSSIKVLVLCYQKVYENTFFSFYTRPQFVNIADITDGERK